MIFAGIIVRTDTSFSIDKSFEIGTDYFFSTNDSSVDSICTMHTGINTSDENRDLVWDAFIASLHRVWEYAPEFSPSAAVNLSGRNVLVVDNDPQQNSLLCTRLERLGLRPFSIDSILVAKDLLEDKAFDLLVLDIGDDPETVIRFCREISDDAKTMQLPIIMVSEEATSDLVQQCRNAGARFYLRKPYDPYVLLTIMVSALQPLD